MKIEPQTKREKVLLTTMRNSERRINIYTHIGPLVLAIILFCLFPQYPPGSSMRLTLLMLALFSLFLALNSYMRLIVLRTFLSIISRIENEKQFSQQSVPE